jgi:hypothetical protein
LAGPEHPIEEPPKKPENQTALLARYQENCAEARHLTTLLERTTAMVAQTSGVLLGLMGFSGKGLSDSSVGKLMPAFFILLGLWGVVSTIIFEARAEEHRRRIIELMKELEPAQPQPPRPVRIIGIWVFFHACVAAIGVILYVLMAAQRSRH